VQETCRSWLAKLETLEGKPVNTSLYSLLIPFENMGKMGFSVEFGVIKAGEESRMLHLIEVMFASIGKIGQLSWPASLAKDLHLGSEQTEFEQLSANLADQRENVSVFVLRRQRWRGK
jgi:hypothetical protein